MTMMTLRGSGDGQVSRLGRTLRGLFLIRLAATKDTKNPLKHTRLLFRFRIRGRMASWVPSRAAFLAARFDAPAVPGEGGIAARSESFSAFGLSPPNRCESHDVGGSL